MITYSSRFNPPLSGTPANLPESLISIRYFRHVWIEHRHLCETVSRAQVVFLFLIVQRCPSGTFKIGQMVMPGMTWANGRNYVKSLRRCGLVTRPAERGIYALTPAGWKYYESFMASLRRHLSQPDHW